MPGPRGSGRPQSQAGRDRGGRWGQPPISEPKDGGRAAVALLTLACQEGGLETERPGKGPECRRGPSTVGALFSLSLR